MQHSVVIITINYKQNKYTINCVKSIVKSSYKNFHLIIIDNGPTDEDNKTLCYEINKLNDKRIQILKSDKNLGYVGGINYGFSECNKLNWDYILIINNDTILDKNGIEAMVNGCENFNNNAIVTGKVYHYDQPNKLQYIGSKCLDEKTLSYEWIGKDQDDQGQFDQIAERDMIDDIYWMIPKNVYDILGNYSDVFYFNGESSDYCLRALKNNIKLIYTPKAKLWHKGSVSIGGRAKNPVTTYWILQSSLVLRYLHLGLKDFRNYYLSIFFDKIFKRFLIALLRISRGDIADFRIFVSNIKAFSDFSKWKKTKKKNIWKPPFAKNKDK